MLFFAYIILTLSLPLGGYLYLYLTYGRKTALESQLEQVIDNYYSNQR